MIDTIYLLFHFIYTKVDMKKMKWDGLALTVETHSQSQCVRTLEPLNHGSNSSNLDSIYESMWYICEHLLKCAQSFFVRSSYLHNHLLVHKTQYINFCHYNQFVAALKHIPGRNMSFLQRACNHAVIDVN